MRWNMIKYKCLDTKEAGSKLQTLLFLRQQFSKNTRKDLEDFGSSPILATSLPAKPRISETQGKS